MGELLMKLSQYSSQKFNGIHEISPKYPSMKSSWGSKYFSTQRGVQCSLPRVMLAYRSLLTPTCWQACEKSNLLNTIDIVTNMDDKIENHDRNDGSEETAKFNWNEICDLTKFVKKKTPRECLMQYRNSINPEINQNEWSEEEKIKLQEAVRLFQEHDWCSIAEVVGDIRTPLQCLQTYQVRLNKQAINTTEWTADEDHILAQAVALYGIKNWQHVANCLPGRSANQCHARWRQESKVESTKSGKWTDLEERKLICAVIAYGEKTLSPSFPSSSSSSDSQDTLQDSHTSSNIETNASSNIPEPIIPERSKRRPEQKLWMKISQHVPGRDEIKCREKWVNVLDPQVNSKPFTPEEDLIILRETTTLPLNTDSQPTQSNLESDGIYSTGANWSAIAALLPGRTDNHVWRRWKELNGKMNSDVYKETSRKRKAINPALRNRAKATKVDQRNYQLVLSVPSNE